MRPDGASGGFLPSFRWLLGIVVGAALVGVFAMVVGGGGAPLSEVDPPLTAIGEGAEQSEESVSDPDGPSRADLEAGIAADWGVDAGEILRVIGIERDETAPEGTNYWVVQFEYQQANTTVLRCGVGFERDLLDEWVMGSTVDCEVLQEADLMGFSPPDIEVLRGIGCEGDDGCDLEIADTAQTSISSGDLFSGQLLLDEPALEVRAAMTRNNWPRDRGPGTCAYAFYFLWDGNDWVHVDDGMAQDVESCTEGLKGAEFFDEVSDIMWIADPSTDREYDITIRIDTMDEDRLAEVFYTGGVECVVRWIIDNVNGLTVSAWEQPVSSSGCISGGDLTVTLDPETETMAIDGLDPTKSGTTTSATLIPFVSYTPDSASDPVVQQILALWQGLSEAWDDGVASGYQYLAENNYPSAGCTAEDFQSVYEQSDYPIFDGYWEVHSVVEGSIDPEPDWIYEPIGSVPDGTIYSLDMVTIKQDRSFWSLQIQHEGIHTTVTPDGAYFFYGC